ncbi:hypothetical protein CYLTODRAFT_494040 [Cylindrobasidium torrendii FP15055 ss-10]|uniref:Endoplasmic reticulum junction formation protein lunapark n=1 Tax=Cylindrobasidium torrendii FP15055 ss-10 TaxID=1314674 RepID=A0A0D7AYJ8_9AGAR|nr:hypothetical protein CYLTODRAFT_494040 [Cylindrobasidium torrendii FP15055 ss-10]
MSWVARVLDQYFPARNGDYESVLSALAMNIEKRKIKLADIRLREQRTKFATTIYTLAAWLLYVLLWYLGTLPNFGLATAGTRGSSARRFRTLVEGVPVVAGPVIIMAMVRAIQWWYTRKGNAEEKALQSLLKEQRAKVEEIKKKTNYYSTRELLKRYDASPSATLPMTPKKKGTRPSGIVTTGPASPIASSSAVPVNGPIGGLTIATPLRETSQAVSSSPFGTPGTPSRPPPTPSRKQWYDKLADAVLGDEDDTARYALVCENCFVHNGLVKESVWDDIQYSCPKCSHFNPSRRSKNAPSITVTSPLSSVSLTSTSMPSISAPSTPVKTKAIPLQATTPHDMDINKS